MFDSEIYFALPPSVPQETPLAEAFDRTLAPAKKLRVARQKAPQTSAELVEEFLRERDLSAGARRVLQSDLEMYLRWLQAHGVTKQRAVSVAQIEKYAHDLRSGQAHGFGKARQRPALHTKFLAPSSVTRKLSAVREWHRFLARRYRWPDPAAQLPGLPGVRVAPAAALALSSEQIRNLLSMPKISTVRGLRDYAVLCLLCAGLSAQEISALPYDEYDESVTEFAFSETAQRAMQDYLMQARPLLLARLRQKGLYSRRLFFSNRGTPLSPLMVGQIVRRSVKGAELPSWVSPSQLCRSGRARRERGAALDEDSAMEVAALPRAAQLRHAYAKAHPRA